MDKFEKSVVLSSLHRTHVPRPAIKWRALPKLPSGMLLPQVVTTPTTVYVGGGVSRTGMLDIYAYDFQRSSSGSKKWQTLPCNNVMVFGMCMFQDRLMTVGGGTCQGLTNKVYSLNPSAEVQEWEEFEPMACARMALTAVSSKSFMVALGGAIWVVGKKDPTPISTVEVYHASTKQWQQVSDIPYPCASMSTTVMNDVCYLMGDINPEERRKVLCVDLLQYSLPTNPPEGSFVSLADFPTCQSPPSLTSETCSSPSLILSPFLSPMHVAQPANMAAAAAAAFESNDAFVDVSDCNGGSEFQSQNNQVPNTGVSSPQHIRQQKQPTPLPSNHESIIQAINSITASNIRSANTTHPVSSGKAKTSVPAIRLSHSPVNAVPSQTPSQSSIPPLSPRTPSPRPPSPLLTSSSFSSASQMISSSSQIISSFSSGSQMISSSSQIISSSSSASVLSQQPTAEPMCSRSVPNLDKMPRVKTPYYFYPRVPDHSYWFTVPPPPTANGCILGINDHLISFGGCSNGSGSKAMYLFSIQSNRWIKVLGGDIPRSLEGCTCALLKSGQILLVGGEDSDEEYSNRVFIGSAT